MSFDEEFDEEFEAVPVYTHSCNGCTFLLDHVQCFKAPSCEAILRSDNQNIIWKRKENAAL